MRHDKYREKMPRYSVVPWRYFRYYLNRGEGPAGIAEKFRGMGTVPELRGGDVGVYIPPKYRKYYYKLTVFSNAYCLHFTMDLSVVCPNRVGLYCEKTAPVSASPIIIISLLLVQQIRVRYRKGPGWTGLDTNNLFLLNCRRERQTNPNPNPNPGPLR